MKFLYASAAVVVTACGAVFLLEYGQKQMALHNMRMAEEARLEENAARTLRINECWARASTFFGEPRLLDPVFREKEEWTEACAKLSVPAEQLPKDFMRTSYGFNSSIST